MNLKGFGIQDSVSLIPLLSRLTGHTNQDDNTPCSPPHSPLTTINTQADGTYHVPGTVPGTLCALATSSSLHHPSGYHYCSLLQLSKLGHRESHVQGPTAGKWQSRDLNPDSAVPASVLISAMAHSPHARSLISETGVVIILRTVPLAPTPHNSKRVESVPYPMLSHKGGHDLK